MAGLWMLLSLAMFLLVAGGVGWALLGRPITAPDWVQSRIEARIARALPDISVNFGDMRLLVQRDGLARVTLSDVRFATQSGVPIVDLREVSAGFQPSALLRGRVALERAAVSGVFATLRRDNAGRLGLALGPAFQGAGGAPDLPSLIAAVDAALRRPALADLRAVEVSGLTLRLQDARAGRDWTTDGGRLRLTREGGTLRLTAGLSVLGQDSGAATLDLNAQSDIGRNDLAFAMRLGNLAAADIATQSPALAWLKALDAPISGALRGGFGSDGGLAPLNATLQIGRGVLQPNPRTTPIPFSSARTVFTYEPEIATLSFDEISLDSGVGRATAEGRAVIEGLETGWPSAMIGQFALSEIVANPADLFVAPVEIERAETDLRLELDPFRLSMGRLRVDGLQAPVYLRGALTAGAEGWDLSLDGETAKTTPQEVARYWPPRLAPQSRQWFLDNVRSGRVREAQFALRSRREQKPALYLDFGFDDAVVRYARTLPEITDGVGQFTLIGDRLSVMLDAGNTTPPEGGTIALDGSSFAIADTRIKPARGRLELSASGPITAALSFLDQPPLRLLDRANQPVTLAEGDARASGFLELPLRKGLTPQDLDYDFAATLGTVTSETILPGRSIAAETLSVAVRPDQLRIAGQARIDGVPFDGSWTQPLGVPDARSVVEGEVQLSAAAARTFGIALPDGLVRGQGPGRLTLRLGAGEAPDFTLSSSLAGIGLSVPALGFALSPGGQGRLEVAGTLGAVPRVRRLALDAPGLRAEGEVVLNADRSLDRLSFSRVRVGNWLDAPVTLRPRGRGQTPAITLRGGRLDLSALPDRLGGGGSGGAGSGGPIAVALDEVVVTQGITLSDLQGNFTTRGGFQGEFSANMGRRAPLTGRIAPQGGRSAVLITAPNAGRVLEASGLLETVKGGAMSLRLVPAPGVAGAYDGTLDIREVRLQNAPVIGSILDAISIVGLIDQLNGPGIYFSEVDADFRLTPQQLVLRSSSATGPSMGISLDGYYGLASKAIDMQGVVSPIYILNGIGSLLTRKGEGLIGFNFNIGGTTGAPRVAVNPLSVFTPGMFREIFRRAPPVTPGR